MVESLHPELLLARLHRGVDLVDLVLPDQVPDGRVRHHDLHGQSAAGPARPRQQGLAQDPLEHKRHLRPDLRLLVGREDVDDPVDGLSGRVRVERAEGQVTRLGDPQGGLDRLEVAHLADQNDVGILAQGRPEGVGEGVGVGVELPLVHEALLVLVQVLDGVLDGDHVLVTLAVDLVEHRSQRRRLP